MVSLQIICKKKKLILILDEAVKQKKKTHCFFQCLWMKLIRQNCLLYPHKSNSFLFLTRLSKKYYYYYYKRVERGYVCSQNNFLFFS